MARISLFSCKQITAAGLREVVRLSRDCFQPSRQEISDNERLHGSYGRKLNIYQKKGQRSNNS